VLVAAHEARVSDDIRRRNRRQSTYNSLVATHFRLWPNADFNYVQGDVRFQG